MQTPTISEVGHVAIRVRDLEAAKRFATQMLGMTASARTADQAWFGIGPDHHRVHYIASDEDALDHVGLVAPDAESLLEASTRVRAAGLRLLSDTPLGRGIEDGFAFVDHDGFVFQIYTRMEQVPYEAAPALRPQRLGHVNLFVSDPRRTERMLTEVLDFRVSDRVDDGVFLRCNVDHHGVGVFPASNPRIHHVAWEYPSISEIAAIADRVDARGDSVLWGPLRHGVGRNIATYVGEPSGLVCEFYCDMERIYNDSAHVPGQWTLEGHKWVSLWGPHLTSEAFVELGLPPGTRPA
jgi:catechol 2,3-dioxygenase-like lactoylglutathione lyase family enzyme